MAAASAGTVLQTGSVPVSNLSLTTLAPPPSQRHHQQQQQQQHHHHEIVQSQELSRQLQQHKHQSQQLHQSQQQQQQQQRLPYIQRADNGSIQSVVNNCGAATTTTVVSTTATTTTQQQRGPNVAPGWQRHVSNGEIVYISPSGAALRNIGQIKDYLLSPGTCKCGLPCPLRPNYFFEFNSQVPNLPLQIPLDSGTSRTSSCLHQARLLDSSTILHSSRDSNKKRKASGEWSTATIATSQSPQILGSLSGASNEIVISTPTQRSPASGRSSNLVQQTPTFTAGIIHQPPGTSLYATTNQGTNENKVANVTVSRTPPWRKNSILNQQQQQQHSGQQNVSVISNAPNGRVPPLPQQHVQQHVQQQQQQQQQQNHPAQSQPSMQQSQQQHQQPQPPPWQEETQKRRISSKKRPNFKEDPTGYLNHQTAILHSSILSVHSPEIPSHSAENTTSSSSQHSSYQSQLKPVQRDDHQHQQHMHLNNQNLQMNVPSSHNTDSQHVVNAQPSTTTTTGRQPQQISVMQHQNQNVYIQQQQQQPPTQQQPQIHENQLENIRKQHVVVDSSGHPVRIIQNGQVMYTTNTGFSICQQNQQLKIDESHCGTSHLHGTSGQLNNGHLINATQQPHLNSHHNQQIVHGPNVVQVTSNQVQSSVFQHSQQSASRMPAQQQQQIISNRQSSSGGGQPPQSPVSASTGRAQLITMQQHHQQQQHHQPSTSQQTYVVSNEMTRRQHQSGTDNNVNLIKVQSNVAQHPNQIILSSTDLETLSNSESGHSMGLSIGGQTVTHLPNGMVQVHQNYDMAEMKHQHQQIHLQQQIQQQQNLLGNGTTKVISTATAGGLQLSNSNIISNSSNVIAANNQIIGTNNAGNLISPNSTVVLPSGYVLQPQSFTTTVDGQMVNVINQTTENGSQFIQQQQQQQQQQSTTTQQRIILSPDSKRAKKRKSSAGTPPTPPIGPHSLSPQQSPGIQQHSPSIVTSATASGTTTMLQLTPQYQQQSFQISPGMPGITLVQNKASHQNATPQQQILLQNGQTIIQPLNLIGQQLLVPAGLMVAPETTLLQIQNVAPCGSIITPQGMMIRAQSSQNKGFLSPNGGGQQFIVNGNGQISPIGQVYTTPMGLVVPHSNAGSTTTYVQQQSQQNTTIVQQHPAAMLNSNNGNSSQQQDLAHSVSTQTAHAQQQKLQHQQHHHQQQQQQQQQQQIVRTISLPDTTTHSPRSPERPPSQRSGGSDTNMVQCVTSSEPDSVVSPPIADSAQSPTHTDCERNIGTGGMTYQHHHHQQQQQQQQHHQQQPQNTCKPFDAKIRRLQTPTQFSHHLHNHHNYHHNNHHHHHHHHITSQGNQLKMKPDSHESATISTVAASAATTTTVSVTAATSSSTTAPFCVGELVWGAVRGHPAWPGKIVSPPDGVVTSTNDSIWVQWFGNRSNIELVSAASLKTLSDGLDAHHKAQKDSRKSRKLNSQLERAIQEAMSELDRATAAAATSATAIGTTTAAIVITNANTASVASTTTSYPMHRTTSQKNARLTKLTSTQLRTKPVRIAPAPPLVTAMQTQQTVSQAAKCLRNNK